MTFIERIVETKKKEVRDLLKPGRFLQAISGRGLSLIAEVKKASPSKGIIRADFDPVKIAKEFEKSGAHALSVLTDREYFQGDPSFIPAIKKEVSLPILRKDFIVDSIQIYESKVLGADAILLIKKILTAKQCQEFIDLAVGLHLDVLMEIHNAEEWEEVRRLKNLKLVGVNNRDLESFEVDMGLAERLKAKLSGVVCIAESGYSKPEELRQLEKAGFDAVLIGEGLAKNPGLR